MIKIAPSILAADFTILKDQVQQAEEAGADWFHLDIMDGNFVPNISFGPLVVEAVRKITNKFLDVHLMITNPDIFIQPFADAGANLISVHAEATKHLHRSITLIQEIGKKAGVALNPATPVSFIENIIYNVDLILIMSVNPGFGGQVFIPQVLPKIKQVAELVSKTEKDIFVEVDGGVDKFTAPDIVSAGCNVLVAGSSIFGQQNVKKAINEIKRSITG